MKREELKPQVKCEKCLHHSESMCDAGRPGWPLAGDWCPAFLLRDEVLHQKSQRDNWWRDGGRQ